MLCKIFSSKVTDKQALNNATNALHKVIKRRDTYDTERTALDKLKDDYKERRKFQTATHPGRRETDKKKKKV